MKDKVYIHHVRLYKNVEGILPRGGITVAIKQVDDNIVRVATSYCSVRDVYNKKRGRDIATGRLYKGKCFEIVTEGSIDDILSLAIKTDPSTSKTTWMSVSGTKLQGKRLKRKHGDFLQVNGDTLRVWGW